MTKFKLLRWLLIIFTTLLLSFLLPQLIKMSSESSTRYDFTYYSSVVRQFSFIRMGKTDIIREDAQGRTYTEEQFDSILPLFYYRQMLSDGRMPDSIHGTAVSIDRIKKGNFYFRLKPRDVDRPKLLLFPMYESMSGRVKLDVPDDVFRCSDRFEFIDVEANSVNDAKSQRYQQAMERAGFQFPAQWVAGIPTTRKAYDEGYFIKDASGQVFHVKQVNGKPFVNNTGIGDEINALHFKMEEAPDRRFYGFVFDDQNTMYMVENTTYKLRPLPFRYNYQSENIMIMANMLYWNVNISSGKGKRTIAINSQTLEKVDEVFQPAQPDTWDQLAQVVIPFRIEVEHLNSAYVYPKFFLSSPWSWMVSVILALMWAVLYRQRRDKMSYTTCIGWILVTGLFGFISLFFYRK
ncbi:MAG: DUF4857 domain-containing protein [Marinilabiliaceae bacterium]|nr:DUF4857 domain-containing protein [Marinilabiliaceae bacterium]